MTTNIGTIIGFTEKMCESSQNYTVKHTCSIFWSTNSHSSEPGSGGGGPVGTSGSGSGSGSGVFLPFPDPFFDLGEDPVKVETILQVLSYFRL